MKKLLMAVLVAGCIALPMSAAATMFTMDTTQLASLYETYENPASANTYLTSVTALLDGSVKFVGNVRDSETGWGAIQIGANFWGIPYDGSAGDEPTNVALGMGSLSGFDSYGLTFENTNENTWMFQVYFNVGWTDPGWDEDDYYVQNTWTAIAEDETKTVVLDFTSAEVWKNGTFVGSNEDLINDGAYSAIDWGHITNIGFHVGADVPLGEDSDDWTYEMKVSSVPEPATMLLLGAGLLGLAGFGRRKLFK